jgi:hypothetical protein
MFMGETLITTLTLTEPTTKSPTTFEKMAKEFGRPGLENGAERVPATWRIEQRLEKGTLGGERTRILRLWGGRGNWEVKSKTVTLTGIEYCSLLVLEDHYNPGGSPPFTEEYTRSDSTLPDAAKKLLPVRAGATGTGEWQVEINDNEMIWNGRMTSGALATYKWRRVLDTPPKLLKWSKVDATSDAPSDEDLPSW